MTMTPSPLELTSPHPAPSPVIHLPLTLEIIPPHLLLPADQYRLSLHHLRWPLELLLPVNHHNMMKGLEELVEQTEMIEGAVVMKCDKERTGVGEKRA